MMRGIPIAGLIVLIGAAGRSAEAQVTVQQPVFQTFSAGTTISVPDRGSGFIGGVGRAGSSRRSFGPLRSGSSLGLTREQAEITAHVFIHDLAELDRAVLNQAPQVEADGRWRDANARHAYRSLMSRSREHWGEPQAVSDGERDRATKFLQLGREAEARKALPVARLHYRVAAKYGSRAAEERLADLDGLPVISRRE